jgi:hypothetical protein
MNNGHHGESDPLNRRFFWLFVSLVSLFLFYPFLQGDIYLRALANLLLTTVLLTGVMAARRPRRVWVIGVVLGIPWIVTTWIHLFFENVELNFISLISGPLFFGFTIVILLSHIVRAKKVTADILFGAVSVYILIGIAWTFFYTILEKIRPGSFGAASGGAERLVEMPELFYYSFVTLTTLGYGDITPLNPYSRTVSILESVTGIIYVAVLIAWLVGIRIVQSVDRSSR